MTKLKMNITTKEDLKAENGRLKRELEVARKGIKDLQDNAKDSVPRSEFVQLHEDHKEKNDELRSKLTSEKMKIKKLSELYDTQRSLVIQLDAELENVREQLRQSREESVKYGKENEHLWGLLKIKMEG